MIIAITIASVLAYLIITVFTSVKIGDIFGDSFVGLMAGLFWPIALPVFLLYGLVDYLRARPERKKRANLPNARIFTR